MANTDNKQSCRLQSNHTFLPILRSYKRICPRLLEKHSRSLHRRHLCIMNWCPPSSLFCSKCGHNFKGVLPRTATLSQLQRPQRRRQIAMWPSHPCSIVTAGDTTREGGVHVDSRLQEVSLQQFPILVGHADPLQQIVADIAHVSLVCHSQRASLFILSLYPLYRVVNETRNGDGGEGGGRG